jgi:hypothetical protein
VGGVGSLLREVRRCVPRPRSANDGDAESPKHQAPNKRHDQQRAAEHDQEEQDLDGDPRLGVCLEPRPPTR